MRKISDSYLQQIHYLITNIIPFHICHYHSFIPIDFDENDTACILIAMVKPTNLIANDSLSKVLKHKKLKYKKLLISESDYQKLVEVYKKYVLEINQNQKIAECLKNLDYQIKFQSPLKVTNLNSLKPKPYDLVLGGNSHQQKKINSLVLGGKEGIESRFNNDNLADKINALHESIKYPALAIKLLTETLKEKTSILIWVGYSLLENIEHPEVKTLLLTYQARIQKESLKEANLARLNLQGINLEKANLSNVNWQGTIVNKDTQIYPQFLLIWKIVNQGLNNENLSEINFNQANLKGSKIKNTLLKNSLFSLVNLAQAHLRSVDFSKARLVNVNLDQSNLSQVNFSNCDFSQVNFRESYLKEIDFSYANLNQVSFYKANLTKVSFQNATFNQVYFNQAILDNIDMSYVNFSDSKINLSNLDLSNSKFIQANLTGINFENSNLSKVNFSGANLSNANLKNANLKGTKLTLATYNKHTVFPDNFNPKRLGAILC